VSNNLLNEVKADRRRFKQLAAILDDAAFQSGRRWILEQANNPGLDEFRELSLHGVYTRRSPLSRWCV